ncbi:hypothetical protein E8E15_000569 [Penicillium rubens]|jgi:hypothetical protein|uniref:Pc16g00240 protein n=2 Tax=Penicillium chrysogenum species complex TaxID=254878 RepID=B6H6T2_PENRW|nr:uncharacterized protein N7525_011604 [Penicillium rubens]XP_056567849.1 uncharacterized protein N7489_003676 [Penicillium chrysogenum]CAP92694.1 Pc16g00240 [Penicillium rubens Wisconsin 54-1255]KAF3001060.1 hypothetical protein E8E15_000569 [Penicillium rubens]KAJ5037841.1 hypothetical protein NUH16_011447 [Penicillium rubens]KAJ5243580.1 hypothetical protein N7489_003676 [Penicillium chrysogenum]KAJ5257352.1 hypothetical protein N7524_008908 [Penicillium chrysogenum]
MALVTAKEANEAQYPTTPRASMDEALMPGLVSKSLDRQCRKGFCDFVDAVFPNIYYTYSTRVELPWFEIAQYDRGAGIAMQWAFRSLGTLQIGRVNGDQRQILASQEMYGRGLRYLVQAVKNPATVGTEDTLGAAILLGIYEAMNETGQNSWLLHSRGISHLLRLRGAKSHASGYGRTLLLSFRGLLVYEAFTRGEACFLESEEWRSTLPETLEDEERRGTSCGLGQLMDYAFNEIAQCPGFLAKTKSLVASSRTTDAEREDLISAINSSREVLSDVEIQIMAGVKADHEGNKKESQAFFGLIPPSIKDASVKFTLEGVHSGIALLRQLSVVLMSDRNRQKAVTPWLKVDPCKNEWKLIKNAGEIAQAQKDNRLHPTGPQQQGSATIWHDRIALAMGMPEMV